MRTLPFILIGAVLTSQTVLAHGDLPLSGTVAFSSSASSVRFCVTRGAERRALRLLKAHRTPLCQPKASVGSSSSVSSSVSSVTSSVSSSASLPLDVNADTTIRSQFLLLGETSPILGAGKIFLYEEPLALTSIIINITTEVPAVRSLLVYDDQRHLLGRAPLDPSASTNRSYALQLASNVFTLEKAQERTIYVRADLESRDAGGLGNENVQISSIVVKGNGVWSNHQYVQQTTDAISYPLFTTARSTVTSVKNAGSANAPLVLGANRTLGSFTFGGRKTDSSAHIDLIDLIFDISQNGGVGITNASLGSNGMTDRFQCTVNASQVTCTLIPDLYGSLTDDPRTLTVYGDVTAVDPLHAGFQLTLNQQGTSVSAGAVSWSDGTNTFHWISLPNSGGPVAGGTYYKY